MTKFRNTLHNEKGFTLIELLVVVIIIGILAAVALPNLMGASETAREKRLEADLSTFATALELYVNENGEYPDGTEVDLKGIGELVGTGTDKVLKSVPKDPWGGEYKYNSDGATYTITADPVKAKDKANKHLTESGIQDGDGFSAGS